MAGMPRRFFLGATLGGAATLASGLSKPALAWSAQGDAREWAQFRERFITRDGRVVDDGNGGVSHSEGQGWGMLMAESFNDQDTFRRLYEFTRTALNRPDDALHAWRYKPMAVQHVDDINNATDGDTFIAWALLRGAARWQDASMQQAGTAVAQDIVKLLVRRVGDRTVLLPGIYGFDQPDHVIVNPSYHMPLAVRDLARAVPDARWGQMQTDGLNLIRQARFGRWQLPADWVRVPKAIGRLSPAPGKPPRFSYDAVRVPLYMVWSGLVTEPTVASSIAFWNDPGFNRRMPAWTEFMGNTVAPYEATSGLRAVATLVGNGGEMNGDTLGSVARAHDYYAASLIMLSRLAARESFRAVS